MSLLSRNLYTASGGTVYSFSFPYLDKAHVYVDVEGVPATFQFNGPSQIEILSPIPSGVYVLIYRSTPIAQPLVSFTNGAFLSEDNLDLSSLQTLYLLQEFQDILSSLDQPWLIGSQESFDFADKLYGLLNNVAFFTGEFLAKKTVSGAVELTTEEAQVYELTLTGDTTVDLLTEHGPTVATAITVYVHQDATGGHAISWPPETLWEGGAEPVAASAPSAKTAYTFHTTDAGAVWYGFQTSVDMAKDTYTYP